MKRRDFVNIFGLGVLATSLPVAIAACQPDPPTATTPEDEAPVDSTPRADGFAAIGTVDDLDSARSLASSSFQGATVAVIRSPDNPDSLIAVNALCPHQGCTVAWADDQGLFACPCHGSRFSPDGTVTDGPATEGLGSFEAKIEDGMVLVNVS